MEETCNPTPSRSSGWSQWSTSSPTCQCLAAHPTHHPSNDGPLEAKVDHVVEVIGSHRNLPISDMKGVGSVPPPLNEALHQGGISAFLEES